jgi:hypothetical protein
MAFMIWEGTCGNGVKTGPMPAGTAECFGALPGSTNILMICYCRIAAMMRPPVAGIITGSGALSGNGREELPLVRVPFWSDSHLETIPDEQELVPTVVVDGTERPRQA